MKKILYLASAAALLATSCADDLGFNNPQTNVPTGNLRVDATYSLGDETATRTMWDATAQKYEWTPGDAIGVFEADATNSNLNAMFGYTFQGNNATVNSFYGDVDLVGFGEGNQLYFYYPYASNTQMQGSKINLYVSQYQKFNHNYSYLAQDATYSGSFSSGAAPSVALGTIDKSEEGAPTPYTTSIVMQPLVSFVIFPINGYSIEDITDATLTIQNEDDEYLPLNGVLNVDLSKFNEDGKFYTMGKQLTEGSVTLQDSNGDTLSAKPMSSAPTMENDSNYIVGVNSGATPFPFTAVSNGQQPGFYLWFVIPAGTDLSGTMTLTVGEKPFTIENYTSSRLDNGLSRPNNIYAVASSFSTAGNEGDIYFTYEPDNTYLIKTPAQFIEYCNLISTTDLSALVKNWEALNTELTKNEDLSKVYSPYANLSSMLSGYEVGSGETAGVTIKTGVIDGNLTFGASFNNTLKQIFEAPTGGAPIYPESELAQYFVQVYQTYYDYSEENGEMQQIGGNASSTISLSGINNATISGLTISGEGMFNPGTSTSFSVSNITLNGVTVNNAEGYLLSETNGSVKFSNVVVEDNCSVVSEASNPALFGLVNASDFSTSQESTVEVPNGFISASIFNADVTFNFDDNNVNLSDYNFVSINPESNTTYPVLTVATPKVETLISMVEAYAATKDDDFVQQPYSVIDGTTSYWTGTMYPSTSNNAYAEVLAYNNSSANNKNQTTNNTFRRNGFTFTMDINLRNLPWPIYTGEAYGIGINGGGYTITDALINGEGQNNVVNYSLFGSHAYVTNLKVGNVNIITDNDKALVAILATYPSGSDKTSGVDVTGTITYNVPSTLQFGGFFQSLENNASKFDAESCTYNSTTPFSFGEDVTETPSGFGYIAGIGVAQAEAVDTNSNVFQTTPLPTLASLSNYRAYGDLLYISMTVNSSQTEVYLTITKGYPYESIEDVVLNVSGAGTNLKIYVNFEDTSLNYKGLEEAYYIFENNDGNYSYSGNVEIKNAGQQSIILKVR